MDQAASSDKGILWYLRKCGEDSNLDRNFCVCVGRYHKETDEIEVDLEHQILMSSSEKISFEIDPYKKKILLEGLDDIALTLQYEEDIGKFEKNSIIPSVL